MSDAVLHWLQLTANKWTAAPPGAVGYHYRIARFQGRYIVTRRQGAATDAWRPIVANLGTFAAFNMAKAAAAVFDRRDAA
jgi:hypothetical protein